LAGQDFFGGGKYLIEANGFGHRSQMVEVEVGG